MAGFSGIQIDSAIIRRARRGDTKAHEILYRTYSAPVYTVARRLVTDPAKAEDVLQETFVEVIRSIANFRGEAALGTWIRHIAVSKSLMLLRSAWERRSMQMPEAAEDQLRAPAQQLDDAKDLAQALATLEPQSRVVVWLHDVEGYTHKEIAELMDKTAAFSKSRLSRAHASLRSLLNANETEFTGAALKPC